MGPHLPVARGKLEMSHRSPFEVRFPCGVTRRQFLWQAGNGFFGTAIAHLLSREGLLGGSALAATPPAGGPRVTAPALKAVHVPAKAKSCIFLFMVGGPSHMDTFDPKPELVKRHGQKHKFALSQQLTQKASGTLKGAPWAFHRCGQSGIEVSELFPHVGRCIDDVAVLRGTCADSAAHGAASLQMNTGHIRTGHPSLGSWAVYGLGSANENMPGFVVLANGAPYSGAQNWSSGFMPAAYQGTVFDGAGEPIANLRNARGVSRDRQRRQLDLLDTFNREHLACEPDNGELAARIANYELAFRMQAEAPGVVDLGDESLETNELYGVGRPETNDFGRSCLLARRLVERGVRFVQLYHSNWDTHGENDPKHKQLCAETDRPIAGLLTDLKRRGLLDETLVVWAGEFGRTAVGGPDAKGGRDHHAAAFTTWMAGGGVKGGMVHGATDELGFAVTEGRVHVHDLHATILHLMGVDHERLTYRHAGRDFRLTDVAGEVVREILA